MQTTSDCGYKMDMAWRHFTCFQHVLPGRVLCLLHTTLRPKQKVELAEGASKYNLWSNHVGHVVQYDALLRLTEHTYNMNRTAHKNGPSPLSHV